jgi:hypothetical protein
MLAPEACSRGRDSLCYSGTSVHVILEQAGVRFRLRGIRDERYRPSKSEEGNEPVERSWLSERESAGLAAITVEK